uniref:Uncharacterized protein n=1 Tax=Timema cristinae TaxID=61476 RepID=A0A7R9CKL2_TIMCR|nr:unnamed protein product [Timema cristinae]
MADKKPVADEGKTKKGRKGGKWVEGLGMSGKGSVVREIVGEVVESDEEPLVMTKEKIKKMEKGGEKQCPDAFAEKLYRCVGKAGGRVESKETIELIGMYQRSREEIANKEGQLVQLEKENERLRRKIKGMEERERKGHTLDTVGKKGHTYAEIMAAVAKVRPGEEVEEEELFTKKSTIAITSKSGKKVEEVERLLKEKIDPKSCGIRINTMRKIGEKVVLETAHRKDFEKVERSKGGIESRKSCESEANGNHV